MTSLRTIPVLTAAFASALSLSLSTDNGGRRGDGDKNNAPPDAIVDFGDPVTLAGDGNHVVVPDDTTIRKDGTITFIVNGADHGVAIYPVSNNTTREDITAQLCAHDAVTNACVDPSFPNAERTIRDGKNDVVMVIGPNPPFQRVDDPTDRLLGTSTQVGNVAGAFLVGTTATTVGTHLEFRFAKTGRYLVICMNRNHFLANWQFGFVSVVGGDNNQRPSISLPAQSQNGAEP